MRTRAMVFDVVVVAITIAVTIALFRSAGHDLTAVEHDVRATGRQLDNLSRELPSAADRHQSASADVAETAAELAQARSLRDDETGALLARLAELARKRRDLAITVADAQRRADAISQMRTCLDGVSQALNRLAVSDTAGAHATLTSVDAACRAATASG